MGYATVLSRASVGIQAPQVTIEVHLANGIPSFSLVGLAETTVRESKERVRSAIIQSGFEFPAKRIVVNLAPADLPKHGGRFDLAIAMAILVASDQATADSIENTEFLGELSLSGTLRPVTAALPACVAAKHSQRRIVIATDNAAEASLCDHSQSFSAHSLLNAVELLSSPETLRPIGREPDNREPKFDVDISEIIGQVQAKRALLIAATGRHNILFVGPPGTGKSMLAQRLRTLLPPLNEQQALESASIFSVNGDLNIAGQWRQRPYRSPHHSASATALLGGGASPKPGDISLAHQGILFLDELPEFGRKALDALREPLETGDIHISRAAAKVCYPARFQLVAAMNPSPTGDINDQRSTPEQVLRYLQRLSGPLLDRIDLQVTVEKQRISGSVKQPSSHNKTPTSEVLRAEVSRCQQHQRARQGKLNADMSVTDLARFCRLSADTQTFFETALHKLEASHRAAHRYLKVARTIADIENSSTIERQHLAEALGYRSLDTLIRQLTAC